MGLSQVGPTTPEIALRGSGRYHIFNGRAYPVIGSTEADGPRLRYRVQARMVHVPDSTLGRITHHIGSALSTAVDAVPGLRTVAGYVGTALRVAAPWLGIVGVGMGTFEAVSALQRGDQWNAGVAGLGTALLTAGVLATSTGIAAPAGIPMAIAGGVILTAQAIDRATGEIASGLVRHGIQTVAGLGSDLLNTRLFNNPASNIFGAGLLRAGLDWLAGRTDPPTVVLPHAHVDPTTLNREGAQLNYVAFTGRVDPGEVDRVVAPDAVAGGVVVASHTAVRSSPGPTIS